ncbi:MAG: Rpn family recombination-promoting nuclease/putative transposase [Treponema sp.]|jgi:predicted transposase/invertase (TIGR01784 family)|nr:Rpn family recombination-promoting nuclease/putative transposase [Treponema sp.]
MKTNTNLEPSQRLNPLDDFLFYKVMGEKGDEVQLLGFLNAVLGRSGKDRIESVEIQENKSFAAEILGGKSCTLDVYAALQDGTKVNIEVQLSNEGNMDRRSLYYWSKLYSRGINKGDNFCELPDVIAINIVDFNFLPTGSFHSCFHIREDSDASMILTNALEIHVVDMVKWRKQRDKDIENNPLHRWLTWFDRNSSPELIEKVVAMDLAIMAASERQAFLARSQELADEMRHEKAYRDDLHRMSNARREGLAEGKLEIARNALAQGLPVDMIEKLTGLDGAQIRSLIIN